MTRQTLENGLNSIKRKNDACLAGERRLRNIHKVHNQGSYMVYVLSLFAYLKDTTRYKK